MTENQKLPLKAALLAEHPLEAETINRLEALATGEGLNDMSIRRLETLLKPKSRVSLVLILENLVAHGNMARVYKVATLQSGVLGTFHDYEEIPEQIHDPLSGKAIPVLLEMIQPTFSSRLRDRKISRTFHVRSPAARR